MQKLLDKVEPAIVWTVDTGLSTAIKLGYQLLENGMGTGLRQGHKHGKDVGVYNLSAF